MCYFDNLAWTGRREGAAGLHTGASPLNIFSGERLRAWDDFVMVHVTRIDEISKSRPKKKRRAAWKVRNDEEKSKILIEDQDKEHYRGKRCRNSSRRQRKKSSRQPWLLGTKQ